MQNPKETRLAAWGALQPSGVAPTCFPVNTGKIHIRCVELFGEGISTQTHKMAFSSNCSVRNCTSRADSPRIGWQNGQNSQVFPSWWQERDYFSFSEMAESYHFTNKWRSAPVIPVRLPGGMA